MPADYSGQNLRGRSFKGQNLEGADFSGADIRGADFTRANLRGANFTGAKAGLQKRWVFGLMVVVLLLVGLSGFLLALNGLLILLAFSGGLDSHILGWIALATVFVFIFLAIRQGVTMAFGFMTVAVGFTLIFTFVGLFAIAAVFAIAGAFVVAVVFAFTFAAIGTIVFTFVVAFTFAVAIAFGRHLDGGFTVAIPQVIIITLFSAYIAWQAMQGDPKQAPIRNISVAFAAIGGTSFRSADLTDVNFTGATLKNADFRYAKLVRTCFHNTKNLDLARPGNSYLQNLDLQKLLVGTVDRHNTKNSKNYQNPNKNKNTTPNKNCDRQNLRGINLQNTNLQDFSFIAADLSQANLQEADLSRAKLVQTQLDGTDFTGATLTGVYIQDWGINTDTKFDGVRCEYVYMRLPTVDDPDPHRKPDNREEVFEDGEFGDFIKPIIDTLDLYHSQGVDPRAIAAAFKQLAEDNPNAELEIVAIERRGEDKILLRAKTAVTANKSELSKEYFINYNQLKALAEREFRELIASQNVQISRLENMITTALERPSFYAQTYNNQGDTTMTGNRHINTGGGNYNERIQGSYIQGNYYAAGQPQSLAQAAAEIQALLKQLEQTYPTTTTSQQMVVAAEAINRIESSPTMKQKVINAVKEGGLAAFEKAIDNPAGAFITGAIKGWQEIEAKD